MTDRVPAPEAFTWIPGREPGLLLIHGLGSFGRCFRHAPESPRLKGRAMLIPDLHGFGGSPAPRGFSFTMEAQADSLAALCLSVGLGRIAIVGHSMGGAVGILLAERSAAGVTHCASAVGNLVPEDCFFSREIVRMGEDAFEERGFAEYVERFRLREEEAAKPWSTYGESLGMTSARAIFRSSVDLVRLSDERDLLGRFLALRCPRTYLCDTDNPMAASLDQALTAAEVPIARVPRTGHMLMEENPEEFYSAVADFLEDPRFSSSRG
jgi:pimeloyl-ACP methyl ester carboxylesterase